MGRVMSAADSVQTRRHGRTSQVLRHDLLVVLLRIQGSAGSALAKLARNVGGLADSVGDRGPGPALFED